MMRTLAIAVIGGALSYLLAEAGSRHSRLVALFCVLATLLSALASISGVVGETLDMLEDGALSSVARDTAKILGVGYTFGVAEDSLDALGECHISRSLELACRAEIMLITLPYVKEIIKCALSFLE